MKRLLLYVHFNKFNQVSSHVLYQLENMRSTFSNIIFISNSLVNEQDISQMKSNHIIDDFIQRDNIGFDFAAWRDGMLHIGFDQLKDYDSVTIMNDTCFGPLWELEDYYVQFEEKDCNFWGMTNHRALPKILKEHIQSYFISFKHSIVISEIFEKFWKSVADYTNVQNVIDEYETQMTSIFVEAGFKYDTVLDVRKTDIKEFPNANFSQIYSSKILKEKVPFLKVKAVGENPVDMIHVMTPYILEEIAKVSDYPVDLIVSHMSKINRPDFEYLLPYKYVKKVNEKLPNKDEVAIHLHVFFEDLLEEFLDVFTDFHFDYKLFITTDTNDKALLIKNCLEKRNLSKETDVLVTGNIGRDLLPMLKLKDKLSKYKYIGHFHTKKSELAIDYLIGQSWRRELIDMLVKPSNNIVSNMVKNDEIGVIIADIPTCFRYHNMIFSQDEKELAHDMNILWSQMNCKKHIDFRDMNTFVMSYGSFIWFKYDALSSIFELDLTDSDIPEEPIPQNSILHALERLFIYVAWDKNYDFRIGKNQISIPAFVDNRELNGRGSVVFSKDPSYVDFNQLGGIKGATKYIFVGPWRAMKYIIKRMILKVKSSS